MNSKKLAVRTMGTFLGLVCGIVLNHQAVHADTNEQENPRVATSLVETTESTANINNTELSNTNTQTTVTNNQESPNLTDTPTTYPATNDVVGVSNSNVADMNNDASNSDIVNDYSDSVASDNDGTSTVNDTNNVVVNNDESAATNTPLAQGTWGTSKWDYTQDGADYVLTFHAGTLGTGGINQSKEFHDVPRVYYSKEITKIILDQGVVANKDSSYLFANLHNLKEIIGLSNLDTSNVTNMEAMFRDCYDLQNIDVSSFNTSKVTDMDQMFFYCSGLKQLDLSNFDLSRVQSLSSVVYLCTSLTSINLCNLMARSIDLGTLPNLSRIVVNNDIMLTDLGWINGVHIGKTMPGTNKKVISNDWVAVSGYQKGKHYTSDELANLIGRDQITTYEWDIGQSLDDQEVKAVTRTINVHQPNGQVQTENQTAMIERTVHYNDDGTLTYGDWSKAQWDNYPVSAVAGYQASMDNVVAQGIDGDTQDQTVDIYYTPIEQTVTIQYLDPAGNEVGTQTLTGYAGEIYNLHYRVPNGYELIDQPQTTITIDASGKQVIQAYVEDQIAQSSESKTMLRVINVHYPSGATKHENQLAVLHRNLYVDQVTHETIYGTWSTGNFDEYHVPVVNGYTASQPLVQGVTVTSADPSVSTIDIYYSQNS